MCVCVCVCVSKKNKILFVYPFNESPDDMRFWNYLEKILYKFDFCFPLKVILASAIHDNIFHIR